MKKTKLLTSVTALALVISLGACDLVELEENLTSESQESESDPIEDEELEQGGYTDPAALLEVISDTQNYSMDLTYTEYRTSTTKTSTAQESLTDEERQEWYDTLSYRSSSKWHEEVSEHLFYGRAETRVYGYTGILVWDEESQSWKYDAYDYEYSTYYEILAFDGYAYRQDQSAEEVVRVYIKDSDDWLLYCLWDANGAGGFSGKLHEILHLIPETQDMVSYAYLTNLYPTLLSDIVSLGDGHYDIDDTNGAATGFASASLARLSYQDEIEDYNVTLQDSIYDPEIGQWDLNYASDIFINSTRAYQHTFDVSLYDAGLTVPPYDLDSLPELGEDIWYGYGY